MERFLSRPRSSHPSTVSQTSHLFTKVNRQLPDPHDLAR